MPYRTNVKPLPRQTCETCGKLYRPFSERQRYCCTLCAANAKEVAEFAKEFAPYVESEHQEYLIRRMRDLATQARRDDEE